MASTDDLSDPDYSIEVQELGFTNGQVQWSAMYITLYQTLSNLHAQGNIRMAIDYFNDMVGHFQPLWIEDTKYIDNCIAIEEFTDAEEQIYRLQLAEFVSMLDRHGILPKPNVSHVIKPPWEVPKTIPKESIKK